MRAKFIYEKFTEDSDPIHDLGIGIYAKHNFNSREELNKFVYDILPNITGVEDRTQILANDERHHFKQTYWDRIKNYCMEHTKINNKVTLVYSDEFREYIIMKENEKQRKKLINEKFTEDSDPIHDLGIGIYTKRNFENTQDAAKFLFDILYHLTKEKDLTKFLDITEGGSFINRFLWNEYLQKYYDQYMHIINHTANIAETLRNLIEKKVQSGITRLDEKFIEDSDPIKDLGIGIYGNHNFNSREEFLNFIVMAIPHILKTDDIPSDIIERNRRINEKYFRIIDRYLEEYISYKNVSLKERTCAAYNWNDVVSEYLIKLGYKY